MIRPRPPQIFSSAKNKTRFAPQRRPDPASADRLWTRRREPLLAHRLDQRLKPADVLTGSSQLFLADPVVLRVARVDILEAASAEFVVARPRGDQ
ncbi:MAG: hypothetical protein JWR80_4161 [Bradyrhizobium sp.]|nr:hypothetical protein [Bradyrhizobium sp.]